MARSSKGKAGGQGGRGGGGGSRRSYARDNRGRFASTGATARGGRLKTASGNKRARQTMQAEGGPRGTIGKPKGLKPSAAKPAASNRLEFDRAAALRRYDRANANVFKYTDAGDAFKASRARAARDSYAAANKATGSGSQRSLYMSQAKYSTIANPKSRQRAKTAEAKGRTIGHGEAYARRNEAQLRRGIETGRRAQAYLSSQNAHAAPIGSRLSNAWGKAGRVEWGSRNALSSIANKRLNQARKKRVGGFS